MISIDKINNRENILRVGCNAMVFKLIETDRKCIQKNRLLINRKRFMQ